MQVKKAEEFLGKTLFRRTHNSLLLTDAGRSYYPAIAEALMGIPAVSDQLLENEARSRVAISTIQSLAEKRVAPAISRFRRLYPGTGIELRIEADPVDLLRTSTDIRISYESHLYPQHTQVPLFKDVAYPLCFRAFHEQHVKTGGMAAVPDHLLIHTDWGEQYASHPTSAGWFRAAGAANNPDVRKGLRVGGAAVAFALAAQGAGMALVPRMLTSAAPENPDFAVPDPLGLPLPYSYFAILPKSAALQKRATPKTAQVKALLAELARAKEGPAA